MYELEEQSDGPGNQYPYIAARKTQELAAVRRELAALKEKTKYAYASEDALISSDFFKGALKKSLAFKDREILALRHELLKSSGSAPAAPSTPAAGGELLELALAQKEYIDALPDDVVAKLPAMPGFDGDWAAGVLERAKKLPASPTIEGESGKEVGHADQA